ncbi:MAG: 1-acyl-sn-glycerol-3-phosphate acyltransferase [Ardenticatenaceae bacterium]|nr:1-acyl-sn-glycerol-3-phosphate acyltransferase [Ardenticatenaceae bacterium]
MFRYRLARFMLRLVQQSISSLTVYGRENIPEQGPYLVVLNHISVADTPALLIGFPIVEWRFFAGDKWQRHWLYGPIMSRLGAIFIDRDNVGRDSLREAIAALEGGAVFGLAPEGSRSKGGQMRIAKDGAAYLASRSHVPILPVGFVNMEVLFANTKKLRRTPLELHIGRPFFLPVLDHRARSQDLPLYSRLIMAHIGALLPERYLGYYENDPAVALVREEQDPWPLIVAEAQQGAR